MGLQESDTTELIARIPAVSASKVTALPGRLMDVFPKRSFYESLKLHANLYVRVHVFFPLSL